MHIRVTALVLGVTLLGLSSDFGFAQNSEPKETAPNEADVILQDSKKSDQETPKEVSECMSQWGPQTQMTKEEWAASCRRTLRYFPETP
jgi:septal ring-binding cell division protein DamX